MRRIILFVILAGAGAVPARAAERNFVVTDFDEIRLIGPHEVTTTTARATTVRGSGERLALDALIVESRNRVLTIRTRTAAASDAEKRPVRIAVTAPQLRIVRLNGSGAMSVAELRGPAVEATLSGSGTILVGRIAGDLATLRLTGSGTLRANGQARSLDASLRGAGSIDGAGLIAADLKLISAGSGTVSLAATRSAAITSAGSGTVTVTGKAACTVKNAGTGTVSCGTRSGQTSPSSDN
jgi:Putative auto-transporter adhesin, head GIN domain